jgi:hypothetical protein
MISSFVFLIRLNLILVDISIFTQSNRAFMNNTDKEYKADFKYMVGKNTRIITHYDSDMGIGFGVNVNY